MKPRTSGRPRAQMKNGLQGEGPNWVLIAGGALLSTLSIRLGYKLRQLLDPKLPDDTTKSLRGNGNCIGSKKSANSHLHQSGNCFAQDDDDDGCYKCVPGYDGGIVDIKQQCDGQTMAAAGMALPLVTVSAPEFNKENGVIWVSSPDRIELPHKPFHQSNSSDSPSVSESGSDIYSKREVIQKLRQQLKRRDEMILEMQGQIAELQNSLSAQLSHSAHLQSMLDISNRDLLDSEREIQRLRKAIADHCVGHVDGAEKASTVPIWPAERNGQANGYFELERNSESSEKGRGENERIEMLRREVGDLKEVIEGKEFLLQSYKEQKVELTVKIKELQQKLDSQLPNIL